MDRNQRGIAAGGYVEPIGIALALAEATGLTSKIGQWLGGDNGEDVANRVVDVAKKATGTKTPEDALDAVKRDPKAMLAVEEQLIENEHELKKLALKDRADARSMQVAALGQSDKFAKRFIYFFAIAWSVFAFIYIGAITFIEIPDDSRRFADTILGFLLGTALAGVFNFFFGSSQGNEQRQEGEQLRATLKDLKGF